MAESEIRGNIIAGAVVVGVACVASVVGLMAGDRPARAHAWVFVDPPPVQIPTAVPLDPQPEVLVQNIAFSLTGPQDSPEAAALLERLGGPDPNLSGLLPADPGWDDVSVQRALRGVPGAELHRVMGVITRGGESAGIAMEMTQTDPTTGVVTGRKTVTMMATVTVLADGRLAVTASLRDESDTTTLAVLGRRVGVPIGRTGEVQDAMVIDADDKVAIRLPGAVLGVVYMSIQVRTPAPAPSDPGEPQ